MGVTGHFNYYTVPLSKFGVAGLCASVWLFTYVIIAQIELQCTGKSARLYITLKGELSPSFTSEMSLPEAEVLIEKLLPEILGRLGTPSKRRFKVAFVQRKCAVTSSVSVQFLYLRTTSQAEISVCMQGSRECCPACVRLPELFVRVSTAVRYATKGCVTSHGSSVSLLGTFQASTIGE